MSELNATNLLDAWEKGRALAPVQKALLLLSAFRRESAGNDLARLPIGRRDRLLLELRRHLFGQELIGVVKCPACQERLEFNFQMSDVMVSDDDESHTGDQTFQAGEYRISFCLPNSLDLMAVASLEDAEARRSLLQRCVTRASQNGSEIHFSELPQAVVEAIDRHMANLDPQADVEIDLSCPQCDQRWSEPFDVDRYFWEEIDRWARRTIEEVHILASIYGWRQDDILNLSAWRRQAYVELARNR